jgi:branched-chain amino acid transport system substrate-binding protein
MLSKRKVLLAAAAAAALLSAAPARAADEVVKIGWDGSLTGGDAQGAILQENGAKLAVDDANAKKIVKGVTFELYPLDDGTATAGQYDPAQAAINARKFLGDKKVVAIDGPQMSGAAKAMTPILSQGDMAMITPSATNPDLTNPQFAAQFRPAGKVIFFRTVATDAYQGPYMANYYKNVLHVKSVYVLDDTGAYGEGLANAFEGQANKIGIKVLGHDKLDPKAADYSAILTKIKSLNPDAIYYGGVMQAAVKLVKQSYDIIPKVIKGGGDGLYDPEMFTGAGYPAAQGWYATNASPHLTDDSRLSDYVKRYKAAFNVAPDDYSICSYDAVMAIIQAVKKVKAEKKPINHDTVRAAMAGLKINTLQGPIQFDANGDLKDKVITVFQAEKTDAYPLDDSSHQFKYLGVAPAS